jgi:hypothetical protein
MFLSAGAAVDLSAVRPLVDLLVEEVAVFQLAARRWHLVYQ